MARSASPADSCCGCLGLRAGAASPPPRSATADAEAAADTEFLRERLRKWCENGLERITADLEDLQMHKAMRNVTRLFERIQDFEKRVMQRRGALCREDAEAQVAALVLLAQSARALCPARRRGATDRRRDRGRPGSAGAMAGGCRFRRVESKPLAG